MAQRQIQTMDRFLDAIGVTLDEKSWDKDIEFHAQQFIGKDFVDVLPLSPQSLDFNEMAQYVGSEVATGEKLSISYKDQQVAFAPETITLISGSKTYKMQQSVDDKGTLVIWDADLSIENVDQNRFIIKYGKTSSADEAFFAPSFHQRKGDEYTELRTKKLADGFYNIDAPVIEKYTVKDGAKQITATYRFDDDGLVEYKTDKEHFVYEQDFSSITKDGSEYKLLYQDGDSYIEESHPDYTVVYRANDEKKVVSFTQSDDSGVIRFQEIMADLSARGIELEAQAPEKIAYTFADVIAVNQSYFEDGQQGEYQHIEKAGTHFFTTPQVEITFKDGDDFYTINNKGLKEIRQVDLETSYPNKTVKEYDSLNEALERMPSDLTKSDKLYLNMVEKTPVVEGAHTLPYTVEKEFKGQQLTKATLSRDSEKVFSVGYDGKSEMRYKEMPGRKVIPMFSSYRETFTQTLQNGRVLRGELTYDKKKNLDNLSMTWDVGKSSKEKKWDFAVSLGFSFEDITQKPVAFVDKVVQFLIPRNIKRPVFGYADEILEFAKLTGVKGVPENNAVDQYKKKKKTGFLGKLALLTAALSLNAAQLQSNNIGNDNLALLGDMAKETGVEGVNKNAGTQISAFNQKTMA